jgi:RNA 2',3'-cyclic 3'-phosphodiesterase
MSSGKIRAFLAIELPAEVRQRLQQLAADLDQFIPSGFVRWVKSDQMHLTLEFLGYLTPEAIEQVQKLLPPVVQQTSRFHLLAQQLGAFPNWRRPRVIWVGLAGQIEMLLLLQSQIDALVKPLIAHPEERPYHPHLTLGRIKEPLPNRITTALEKNVQKIACDALGSWTAEAVQLFRSDLSSTGARYTPIASFPLRTD